MDRSSIESGRIRQLNDKPIGAGEVVVYRMQQSQRAVENHALEYAVELANSRSLPVLVVFQLMPDYPEANARHYTFMLEGLLETREALRKRGIQLAVFKGTAESFRVGPVEQKAAAIVVDRGYLRHQQKWRRKFAEEASCRVIQVESDLVVPVETASYKAEYMARFLRPKLQRFLPERMEPLKAAPVKKKSLAMETGGLEISDIHRVLKELKTDLSAGPVTHFFKGGTRQAERRFADFLERHLPRYPENSSPPHLDGISRMSPYLHFGQVSPLYLLRKVIQAEGIPEPSKAAYIEQLVVRRELAFNYIFYKPDYDQFKGLPVWARLTLQDHAKDRRPYIYTAAELEAAQTRDPYWNASMKEMVHTGFMHNTMRMYWAKKILEWSPAPEAAYETSLYLNNKYFLDGRDPNSYVGVGWCFGLHDRPWKERPVFGKVRYMAASGLERKYDMRAYVSKIDRVTLK